MLCSPSFNNELRRDEKLKCSAVQRASFACLLVPHKQKVICPCPLSEYCTFRAGRANLWWHCSLTLDEYIFIYKRMRAENLIALVKNTRGTSKEGKGFKCSAPIYLISTTIFVFVPGQGRADSCRQIYLAQFSRRCFLSAVICQIRTVGYSKATPAQKYFVHRFPE